MRSGRDPSFAGDDDFMFSTPAAPTPSHPKPTAFSSAGLTSPVMSRDDNLRAYAERKATSANKGFRGGILTAQLSHPVPAANTSTSSGSGGMRSLSNAGVVNPTNTGDGGGYTNRGYEAYGEGRSMRLGMSMMRVMWGITHTDGLVEL